MEFDVRVFFQKSLEKIQLSLNYDSNVYCILRREYIYDISLNSFTMRNISDSTCKEYQDTHFILNTFFFS
jgi:hypothetical protein